MNKKLYRIPIFLLILFWSLAFLPIPAFASRTSAIAILPVSSRISGEVPYPAESTCFRLLPVDNAPMPSPGQDCCDLTITGAENANFPTISYSSVGIYRYTVFQIPGTDPLTDYDKSVYDITVTVSDPEDGNDPVSAISIRKGGNKYDTAEFTNRYDTKKTYQDITVRKVWSDNGKNRPSSIHVQLISEGKLLNTAVLNDANGWTYSWKGLVVAGESWYVQENPVPSRYIASYSYSDTAAIITNTLTTGLIQTGQLVWPIWVLCGAGAILIVFGIAGMIRKRKRDHA